MQKTVITLIDDLDPTGKTEADETVTFALDGITYEIDLTHENAHVLRARLKEFTQAGRVAKTASRRLSQPTTEAAGHGATANRHQGGVDPQAARAWAIEQGLSVPARGRLPKDIKDAYNSFEKFGDRSLLDKLLNEEGGRLDSPIPYQDEEDPGAPAVTPRHDRTEAKATPRRPLSRVRAEGAGSGREVAGTEGADPAEAEARKHYRPIKTSGRISSATQWKNRVASGCPRVDKVEQMTLVERIAALTEKNVAVLRQLAGIEGSDRGKKVSHLTTSASRLENFEFIEQDKSRELGWKVTEFGRYAVEVRSSQTA